MSVFYERINDDDDDGQSCTFLSRQKGTNVVPTNGSILRLINEKVKLSLSTSFSVFSDFI